MERKLLENQQETPIDEHGYPIRIQDDSKQTLAQKDAEQQQLIANAPNHELSRIKLEIFPIVQQAIKCYYQALNEDEHFKESRFHAAIMLEKIYNFHEALKQLSIMVDLLHDDKTVWIQRGLVYQEMGNHELAINDFEQAIELDP